MNHQQARRDERGTRHEANVVGGGARRLKALKKENRILDRD